MQIEGFMEISEALKCGVYVLVSRGAVVYVGKSKCMLVRIYSHRNAKSKRGTLPSWFPVKGIAFDEIHICPCHPDLIDKLEYDMINRYKPRFNDRLKNSLPISAPFTLKIGELAIAVKAGTTIHPTIGHIERRI